MIAAVELPQVQKQMRVRRSAMIADQLRAMILDGTLKPGDRLPTEEQLCRHFGVSRTTLRESVQMLRVSGLLEVTPGRGSFVTMPDLSALLQDVALAGQYSDVEPEQIAYLRGMMQYELVRKACGAGVTAVNRLGQYVVNRHATPEDNEHQERMWHLTMADIAGQKLSKMFLIALMGMETRQRLKRFQDADEVLRVMELQVRIHACIQENNPDMAGRLMTGYLGLRRFGLGSPQPTAASSVA